MLTQERQKIIENYVNQHEMCQVKDLSTITNTSESTIRRDLIQLEQQGLLKRIHGGAQSVKNFAHDVSQHIRFSMNHEAKIKIARYAVEHFVHENDYIFIDAGTTAYEMVPFLADIPHVTIVTNGLETALGALNHEIDTILLGGRVKDDTHAVIGQSAIKQLEGMKFAASFVGTNGLDQEGNLTTPDPEEAAMKKMEILQARHTYILTDASKIGERNFAIFANSQDVSVITTDLMNVQRQILPHEIDLKEVK
ncbi:DeoR/GlpR family DNA-binding transcription regulator [Lactobacillus sp. ESL0701]|uniref:DeoR/GlpR family DNA-binding transcription regulator n=1 Tax=Lactobacillus sp. ESL0701 TaxID=2983217 RepID=UPI0023F95EBC|nr:DeoR/GlpR family DNA-binding transcription regulator [Lactobacillus sp. ESL0701]MDF7671868.1 DeoR/GlpR family DNA-binding transcription regulator [Lactobacillus sp. ESL0701]